MAEAINEPGLRLLQVQSAKFLIDPVSNVETYNDISLKSIHGAKGKLSASHPM
jgi:hypothetical protein